MTIWNLKKSENCKKKCTANIYAQKPGSVPGFFYDSSAYFLSTGDDVSRAMTLAEHNQSAELVTDCNLYRTLTVSNSDRVFKNRYK